MGNGIVVSVTAIIVLGIIAVIIKATQQGCSESPLIYIIIAAIAGIAGYAIPKVVSAIRNRRT